jgi:hypothetical protein
MVNRVSKEDNSCFNTTLTMAEAEFLTENLVNAYEIA